MAGCKESFRLEAASRDGAAAAADEGTLPTKKENNIAPSEWHSRFNLKLFLNSLLEQEQGFFLEQLEISGRGTPPVLHIKIWLQ